MRTWRSTSCLVIGLVLMGPAFAGTVIETESSQQGMNRMIVSGDQVRMESRGQAMLFDASAREMTVLIPSQSKYQVMDQQDVRKLGEQMQQMRSQMEQQLQNVPEDQRAEMRKQMQSMMPGMGDQPEIRVEATGGSASVAGASCREARVLRDDQPTHEVCVAEPGALGIPDEDFETLMSMFGFFEEMAGVMGGGNAEMGAPEMRQMMNELGGMPARAQAVDGSNSWQITGVEAHSVDASQFEVPADYEEAESAGGMTQ